MAHALHKRSASHLGLEKLVTKEAPCLSSALVRIVVEP